MVSVVRRSPPAWRPRGDTLTDETRKSSSFIDYRDIFYTSAIDDVDVAVVAVHKMVRFDEPIGRAMSKVHLAS